MLFRSESATNFNYFESFSELSNLELISLGTKSTKEEISLTKITQPLLTSLSIVSFLNLSFPNFKNVIFAGHSVGEFSAGAFAQFITFEQAIKFVTLRGLLMQNSNSDNNKTGMAAILGGDKDLIIKEIKEIGLFAGNINSNGQIVASGELSKIENLINNPIKNCKIIKLEVSGAFHSPFMQSAQNQFRIELEKEKFSDSDLKFISNFDGNFVENQQDLKLKLINQLTNSVRWDLCQANMVKLGVTGLLEVAPGGVLAGIAKREMPNVEIMSIKNLQDIEKANNFIRNHI